MTVDQFEKAMAILKNGIEVDKKNSEKEEESSEDVEPENE